MLKMNSNSVAFLKKNLPDTLNAEKLSDVLDPLYELIDEKGFAPPHYETYNDFGREAQSVYDDLFYSNYEGWFMTLENVKAIESILSKGDRVELIPTKDGVKIVRVRREPIKTEHWTSP